MSEKRYNNLLARFKRVRIMAVGDVYLDENVYGKVTEVSLEAPIPVLEVLERRYNPGAAGNAACNAASLGATVFMIGVIGSDVNGDIVTREFEARGVHTAHLVRDPHRPTNTYGKLRAGGHNIPTQEVLRTDTPRPTLLSGEAEAAVIKRIKALAPKVDAIMIGDQVSSVITQNVLEAIVACAKKYKLVTVADSRARAGMFKGVDVVVPNDKEAGLAAGIEVMDEASLEAAGRALLQSAHDVLVTRGPHGITIFYRNGDIETSPIRPVQAVDVTGAGDTVTAAVTLTLCAGGSLREAAFLGNLAAGVAVAQEGVVTVSLEELAQALEGGGGPAKVKTVAQLETIMVKLRREGKRVVWTNGCFDILHAGHITYLLEARRKGDVLIVGLNTDKSVRANKGPDRPVVNEQNRALVLSALECVDYIILFDGKTPMPLLKALKPDVYAKGGDYSLNTIVQTERRLVEGYGGEIAIIAGVKGQSTTGIIKKMRKGKTD